MSWLFAKIYDPTMRAAEDACLGEWRRAILSDLSGEVLEVGAGTGANVPHYPSSVERVVLAEPEPHMRRRLEERARDARFETAAAPAEALPFPDQSFDAVVSTLVLCSVGDATRALSEIHRVLRPGGRFAFIEHVAAEPGSARLAWQRRLEPLWRRVAGNCHLTRQTDQAITRVGLDIEWKARDSIRKAVPLVRPSVRGVARKG